MRPDQRWNPDKTKRQVPKTVTADKTVEATAPARVPYSDEGLSVLLQRMGEKIQDFAVEDREVLALVNEIASDNAPVDLLAARKMLESISRIESRTREMNKEDLKECISEFTDNIRSAIVFGREQNGVLAASSFNDAKEILYRSLTELSR